MSVIFNIMLYLSIFKKHLVIKMYINYNKYNTSLLYLCAYVLGNEKQQIIYDTKMIIKLL